MSPCAISRGVRAGFGTAALLALCASPLACLGRNDCSGPSGLCLEPGTVQAGGGGAQPAPSSGAAAGSSGGGGGLGSEAAVSTREVPLEVDSMGHMTSSDQIGIFGWWYAFSDGFGAPDGTAAEGGCEMAGHPANVCASVDTPSVYGYFPNTDGALCTRGTVERIIDKVGSPGDPDWAGMWGAGIAFGFVIDHDNQNGAQSFIMPYDATAHGVVGIAFDIDQVPGMRVELPDSSATTSPAIWKEDPSSTLSPVQPGHNRILFADVQPPPWAPNKYGFDPAQLLIVQLPVMANTATAKPYAFCISNFSVIVND